MVHVTSTAIGKLKALILEHPDDPVVRLSVRDLDDNRLGFSIALESEPREDDEVQDCDGVTVAVDARSADRLADITLDYSESGGFTFRHPDHGEPDLLRFIHPN